MPSNKPKEKDTQMTLETIQRLRQELREKREAIWKKRHFANAAMIEMEMEKTRIEDRRLDEKYRRALEASLKD